MNIEVAKALLEKGDVDGATKLLLDVAHQNPSDVNVWLLLGAVSTRTSNWILGEQSFSKLVQLKPSSPLASSGLVQSYYELGKYDDALSEINRFRSELDFDNPDARVVLAEQDKMVEKIKSRQSDSE